jgi:hypothetical protein
MRMMPEAPNNFQGAAHPLPVPGGRRQRHSPASSLFFVQLLGYEHSHEHVLLVLLSDAPFLFLHLSRHGIWVLRTIRTKCYT